MPSSLCHLHTARASDLFTSMIHSLGNHICIQSYTNVYLHLWSMFSWWFYRQKSQFRCSSSK